MKEFDAMLEKERVVAWIRDFFDKNGKGCRAVLGISGGKDSSVTAALCKEALGKENVVGVLMPNGVQNDIDMSLLLVKHLDIPYVIVNIQEGFQGILNGIQAAKKQEISFALSNQTVINLAPRLRMSTVYAVSQSVNGRVANTCNLSEDWVGYSTRYGDSVGDFSPLSRFTVQEVKAIGRVMGLPEALIEKAPSDGLTNRTDEDNLGFTYQMLDHYIRTGEIEDPEKKALIDKKHFQNKFKLALMPVYEADLPIQALDE